MSGCVFTMTANVGRIRSYRFIASCYLVTRKICKGPNISNGEALMERSGINLSAGGTQAGALAGN